MSTETVPVTANPLEAVKHAAGSDIGLRREENQDSFGIIENGGFKLFIVADGMGGVKGGGIASNLAINVLKECLEDKTELNEAAITSAVEHANTEIFEKGTGDPALAGMGTTFVGLGFVGSNMIISSVGDSRAYRVRDNSIQQLTVDHTLVQELLRSGAISAEQADNHPVSHMLTRSLGPAPSVEVDCWVCQDGPARGDIYIMCSDGLYNLVHGHEIATIVQDNYIDVAVQKLIKLANERGGTDNVTVIVIEIGESFPMGPEDYEPTSTPAVDAEITKSEADEAHVNGEAESNVASSEEAPPISMSNGKHDEAEKGQPAAQEKTIAETKAHAQAATGKKSPKLRPTVDMAAAQASQEKVSEQQAEAAAQVAEAQAASTENQRPRFSRTLLLAGAFALTLVSFVGGFFAPRLMGGNNDAREHEDVLPPIIPQAQIAKFDAEVPAADMNQRSMSPALRLGFSDLPPSLPSDAHNGAHDEAGRSGAVTNEDINRITRRKGMLRELLLDLEDKIGAFEKPLSAKLVDQLKDTRIKRESMDSQEDELRGQIDVATRRLAVWYGRRKRLQTTDPINLATEVAVASPGVKDKKEIFELATWSYLKEAEVLRYNPSDAAQERKVFDLARVRKDRQRELAEEVRRAIDKEVSESDRAIAELTLQRDKLLVEIENLRRSEEYVKILMGSDSRAKEMKRKELMRERDVAAAELEELNHISPESFDQGGSAASDSGAGTALNEASSSEQVAASQ